MGDLLLILILIISAFCLGCGLGMGYREAQSIRPAGPEPGDEELLIFDRVSTALSELPPMEDKRALQDAEAEVMRRIGNRYGLGSEEVQAIYRKVWRWKSGRR